MLTLRLLGGLSLSSSGRKLGPAASQKRPLALLAIIAASGSRGVSREQALLYLWPESTTSGARNTLNQTLYALRRGLHEPRLLSPGPMLRLNPEVVRCDLWSFEEALAQRDLEAAAAQYGGPFLQYFGLRGAPEFDRWIDTERARLAQRFQQLAVTVAERSAQHGDHVRAIHWWRALVAQEPHSALAAAGLTSSLAAAGDRPAALTYLREYEASVRSELGLPLEPRLAKLMTDLERSPVPSVPLVTESQVATLLDEGTGAERYTRSIGAVRPGGPQKLADSRAGKGARQPARKATNPPDSRAELIYRELVESAADVIYAANLHGCFTFANAAAEKVLGRPRNQILGQSFTEFVREDFRHATVDFYARQVQTMTPLTYYEFPVVTPTGGTVWLGQHVQLMPVGKPPTGIMAIARDITLSKHLETGRNYLSVRDRATKLLNVAAFRVMVDHRIALAHRISKGFLLIFVTVENAEDVLAAGGMHAADDMVGLVANALRSAFRKSDAIARLAVDKFAVLAVDAHEADTTVLETRFQEHLKRLHDPGRDTPWPHLRVTAAFYDPALPPSMDALFGRVGAPEAPPVSEDA